jgi:hypothetical protein
MASIVTYDVPEKHFALKKALLNLGYQDQISGTTCEIIYFPNTTLHHLTKTPLEARKDVESACAKLSIKLERCVATQWTNWAAICGEDFTS